MRGRGRCVIASRLLSGSAVHAGKGRPGWMAVERKGEAIEGRGFTLAAAAAVWNVEGVMAKGRNEEEGKIRSSKLHFGENGGG